MLNTADVCVNSDVANELNDKSTMNKIMEYMALASRCAVRSDRGRRSAKECRSLREKNDALDLAAKIVELLDDPARRAEMGEFGRRRVENELNGATNAPSCSLPTMRCGAASRFRAHRRAWTHEAPPLATQKFSIWSRVGSRRKRTTSGWISERTPSPSRPRCSRS